MSLFDANQDSTDTAIGMLASLPPETPVPTKRSAWTTIPRAVAAAATELAGGALDLAGAYGQVQAAYGADPFEPEKRKERLEIADRLKREGIDWRTDEAQGAYRFARDLRPDPQTAGAAEQIVFGLTKGLTKAIGAGVVLGPAAGAAVFGGSEGAVTAEDLAEQGVDFETRAKVGGVVGGISAAGMALPVAGQTLKQTAGLVVTGGPASFIAQQAASREILRNADYGKIAEQFDPLDPVGLTLATLLPAGFAAWAKGGQIKAAFSKKGKAPKPADAPAPTQEQMDALMTHTLTTARDANLDGKAMEDAVAGWEVEQIAENVDIPARMLIEIHPVKDKGKFDSLVANMQDRGWVGRPVLVWDNGNGVFALTGSHRIAAARRADIDVPVVHVDADKFASQLNKEGLTYDDVIGSGDYRVEDFLRRAGDERAAQLMAQESAISNPASSGSGAGSRTEATGAGDSGQGVRDPHVASVLSRVEDLNAKQPDMPVAIRDDGTPARLADELEAIRNDARRGTDDVLGADDAPLLKVAAECFLSLGATA